jgi:imidazole glycerol-phosphate synthase subunit HisH
MSGASLAVVDYGAGNLKSVQNALSHLGADFFVTSDPGELARAPAMVFPGVGEAAAAMAELKRTGLDQGIRSFFASGKKILGICIGCQIVLESSEESGVRCLGLLSGTVRRFPAAPGLKVPHMGWNQVEFEGGHPVTRGFPQGRSFYFVHSYYPEPVRTSDVCGWTQYITRFPSAIARDNYIAFQFHLEKSGKAGLALLSRFLAWKA